LSSRFAVRRADDRGDLQRRDHERAPDAQRVIRPLGSSLFLVAALLSACATTSPQSPCQAGERQAVLDSLYFGRSMPRGEVKPEEWQKFLAEVITPRFPEGLTSWPAAGQWRNDAGELEKESSYVLQLVHVDSPQAENAIQEVVSIYKKQFHQRAVMRTRSRTCMSF
jgi:Protein of unknown function (DUF3574)